MFGRDFEGRRGPAQRRAGRRDFVRTQRRAVDRVRALLVGRALADHRLAGDQRRTAVSQCGAYGAADGRRIVPVAAFGVPAGRLEAGRDVLAGRKIGAAVDGDAVVVPQHDQPAQLQMPGKADRLVVDPFHQAAVARHHPGAVIDQRVAICGVELPFGHRHADGHGEALPERPGGAFRAFEVGVFRMPGAGTAQLPELANVVHRRRGVAGEVQQRVEQHRAVPGGEHETVAVRPFRRGGIELQKLRIEHRRDIGHAHRHAGMAAVRRLDSVHRQGANGIGHGPEAGRIEAHRNLGSRKRAEMQDDSVRLSFRERQRPVKRATIRICR